VPLFRYPLDHIFYSKEFGLLNLEKLGSIGSDHYTILVGLNYEPDEDNTAGLEKTDHKENEKVEKKIEKGKVEGEKD